jgi:rhodanese-related sulfurtransferase
MFPPSSIGPGPEPQSPTVLQESPSGVPKRSRTLAAERLPRLFTGVIRLLLFLASAVALFAQADIPRLTPAEAAARVKAGAVLVDVREAAEWKEGVVEGAVLLPLSDLRGDRKDWTPFLQKNAGKELLLYCRSGNRSGQAAQILAGEGRTVANAGAFRDWEAAGQPTRKP